MNPHVVTNQPMDETHHRGLASVLFMAGSIASSPPIALAGVIMIGHASLDRVFGYGLKLADSFNHTHLGWIGGARQLDTEAG